MRYDFETVIRRENAGSGKWNEIKQTLGFFPENVIPFSVADMEFTMVPEVREGLKKFLDEEALVPLELGTEFGSGYENYTRMNLGSTTKQTEMAVGRLREAVRKYRNERMISC